ncbi:MAG: hypothetical protein LC624_00350, partial [Halobacteriales archaeon]|nr:hypothetical protein [Halobacteriales archaeon]
SALAGHGLPTMEQAFARAALLLPANDSAPKAGTWLLNGTASGQVDGASFTLASEVGPFVVNRNATQLTLVENRTVVSWNSLNRTFVAQNDAAGQLQADPVVDWASDLRATWTGTRMDVVLSTGPFRKDDVQSDINTVGHIASILLPQAGSVGMIKYAGYDISDRRIEVHSQNMSFAIVTR